MRIYGLTDVGKVRSNNQDTFDFCEYDMNCCYAVVCDGMGGHAGGNIASETAVNAIRQTLSDAYETFGRDRDICKLLELSLNKANDSVFARSIAEPDLKGMGTTAVISFYIDEAMYVAHVGDSRAYIFSDGRLTPVTRDHSVVQEMIDSGEISPEEAEKHPYRHVITRALGIINGVEVDSSKLDAYSGETVLLCSDGLTTMVSVEEIEAVLNNEKPENVCEKLVALANEHGGKDNITVVIMVNDSEGGSEA